MLNSLFGRTVFLVALLAIVWLQAKLWLGEGGMADNNELQMQIEARQAENDRLAERNRILEAEVRDLKQGLEAVEEHARLDLGMIKNGETFVRVTRAQNANPAQSGETR
ncbi:MAG TPA: cell division protein FtsB [Fluviicoccus sp.]|nr:cell division protein FtsB [Fluviicoccus sp.]